MPARHMRTQGLTEGAILAALVAVLAIATTYIPLLGVLTQFLCPLPFAVLVIRHGFRVAAIAAVVATLVAVMLTGPLTGLLILVTFAPMGLVLGIGARLGWQPARIVMLGTLVTAVSTAASFLGLMAGQLTSPAVMFKEAGATMERSIATTVDFYQRLGIAKSQTDALVVQMQAIVKLFPYMLPAILAGGAAVAAWYNYEIGRRVLQRFGYQLRALPPMSTWRVPFGGVWFLPLSSALLVASYRFGRPALLETLGISMQLLVTMAFMLNGLLSAWVILGNFELRKIERTIALVFLISISMTVPLVNILAVAIGVADSLWKVRERWGLPRAAARGARS